MYQDLAEYDPFEPLYMLELDGSEYLDSEPMEEYNWREFLEADDYF